MRERNVVVGDRKRRDLGKKKGRDKIGDLKFPDLPLAHQTHRNDEKHVNEKRSYQNCGHFFTSHAIFKGSICENSQNHTKIKKVLDKTEEVC